LTRFLYSLCLFLVTSIVSLSLWAATLSVSDNLIVTQIDNKSVDHGMLGNKSTFSVNKGSHALIIFYKDVFEDVDFAEDRVIKSKDFVVKFSIKEEKQLNLATIAIKNLAQAESFSKSPTLVIKDERNKIIEIELENVSDYKIAQQVDIAVNTYASNQNIKNDKTPKLAKKDVVSKPIILTSNKQQTGNTLIQVNSLNMLKYWWQKASVQEKNQFKQNITSEN
jgi:uncharacterized protein YccT (UPF0319 family)